MTKRLWGMVGAVVVVLGTASLLNGSAGQRAKAAWVLGAVGANLEWSLRNVPVRAVGLTAGGLLLLGGVVELVRRRRRPKAGFGEPWRTVVLLGREGRSASAIAQVTGLSQDAVRIVLAPVAVDPSLSRGKSFRSSSPTDPTTPPHDPPRGSR